eukprot:TRINITY_DN1305_c0_g2_i27.p1 TRINITY_DN1305_c0_g2~~TRINITY_DN1305_c0_g2_i27.p1  ORF type:complete len:326 (-),score=73.51 TRINITY_DN1305_c0_g2_i27:147-1124(-)
MEPYLHQEVQARQQLHAEIALRKCLTIGIDWLLHIDVDELFYCEGSLKEHLHFLSENSIGTFSYANYESVPQYADVGDYFVEVSLFKKNLSHVELNGATMNLLNFWKTKTRHGQYFIAYDVGKSFTRVLDGVTASSVHKWKLPPSSQLRSLTAIKDVRSLDLHNIFEMKDAFILHYVSCGFSWWHEKYQNLGNFPDFWFQGKLKIHPSFHLDSRDVIREKGDTQDGVINSEILDFYKSQVVVADSDEIERQVNGGMCVVLVKPSQIILSGFPEKKVTEKESLIPSSSVPTATVHGIMSTTRTPSVESNISLDQMWIISSLVGRYL